MEFTYKAYRNLIIKSLENGYKICSYKNYDSVDKAIILRHDIDFCPNKAIDIAKIEHQLGVNSTYFVLLSTEFYNVFSKKTAGILNEILDMGHEIGLHFDEQRYKINSIEQMRHYVYQESSLLERALGTNINVVSMHRPSKLTLDINVDFDGLINSYSHMFFKDMKYISDSRMYWRENVMDIINANTYKKIHILTHPFWYSYENEGIKKNYSNL